MFKNSGKNMFKNFPNYVEKLPEKCVEKFPKKCVYANEYIYKKYVYTTHIFTFSYFIKIRSIHTAFEKFLYPKDFIIKSHSFRLIISQENYPRHTSSNPDMLCYQKLKLSTHLQPHHRKYICGPNLIYGSQVASPTGGTHTHIVLGLI